jgi:hypothetical protein
MHAGGRTLSKASDLPKIAASPRSGFARNFAVEGIFSAVIGESQVRNVEIRCVS